MTAMLRRDIRERVAARGGDDPSRRLQVAYDQFRAYVKRLERQHGAEVADEERDAMTERLLAAIEEGESR